MRKWSRIFLAQLVIVLLLCPFSEWAQQPSLRKPYLDDYNVQKVSSELIFLNLIYLKEAVWRN
jgi:hypothetical protein